MAGDSTGVLDMAFESTMLICSKKRGGRHGLAVGPDRGGPSVMRLTAEVLKQSG